MDDLLNGWMFPGNESLEGFPQVRSNAYSHPTGPNSRNQKGIGANPGSF
jgi:hypothetical protein